MNDQEKPLIIISMDLVTRSCRLEKDVIVNGMAFINGAVDSAQLDELFLNLPRESFPVFIRGDDQHYWSARNCLAWDHAAFCVVQENLITLQVSQVVSTHELDDLMEVLPRFFQELGVEMIDYQDLPLQVSTDDVRSILGWYGYVSYEAGRVLHPHRHREDAEIVPSMVFVFPTKYFVELDSCWIFIVLEGLPIVRIPISMKISFPSPPDSPNHVLLAHDVNHHLTAIKRIQQYLKDGEIYQANFTNRYVVKRPSKPSRRMFLELLEQHVVPCAMYLEYPDFQVLSLSPELFMDVKQGKVVTRPIKGTRPRGKTPQEDEMLKQELRQSEKDLAELAMIVDLMRNDLSRSCLPATVSVVRHATVESYSNVHHLVSTISGKICPNEPRSTWRLILRAFPGGSITGCPKIRAMEIIEEMETAPRGVYTGIMGYLAVNGDAWFNIAIRTIMMNENSVIFNAGGGIVLDSDPEAEYLEMLHKVRHLARYFGVTFVGHLAWINGEMRSSSRAFVPIDVAGVHYGLGCFETIYVKNGRPRNMSFHFQRLKRGLQALELSEENVMIPSDKEINRFLKLNLATEARLKILVTPQISSIGENTRSIVIMTVAPFRRELGCVSLLLLEDDFYPPKLVRDFGIKSTCYGDYLMATKKAQLKGFWDALLQHQGKLLETGRANILLHDGVNWLTPRGPVVRGTVREGLIITGIVKETDLTIKSLKESCCIAICNALHGVQLVERIEFENEGVSRLLWRIRDEEKGKKHVHELKRALEL